MSWKPVLLPTLLVATFSSCFVKANIAGCPNEHPYAFYDGSYCCQHPEESNAALLVYSNPPILLNFDPPCDGGSLRLNSKCCKDANWIPCPHGKGKCRSTVRELCYTFVSNDLVGVGVPSKQFRAWCLDQSDKSKLTFIKREKLEVDGLEWQKTHACYYSSEFSSAVTCVPEVSLEGAPAGTHGVRQIIGGSDSDTANPTAAVTRANRHAPGDVQCKPPRKYVWIRGKLRCRRPKPF